MMTEHELKAHATVEPDGTGQLTMGNRLKLINANDENEARALVMRAVHSYAKDENSPVVLEARDSRGTSLVAVFPNGKAAPIQQPAPALTRPASPLPDLAEPPASAPMDPDLEHTRLASPRAVDEPGHVLRFSTGEIVTVTGSGLIGRRPEREGGRPEDHLVAIDDPERSVSRTHLEFGHTAGQLWILDRRSGNGTIIHQAGNLLVAVPGRRYTLDDGNTVEMGDQTFTVSALPREPAPIGEPPR